MALLYLLVILLTCDKVGKESETRLDDSLMHMY